jgi:hypothetical protein
MFSSLGLQEVGADVVGDREADFTVRQILMPA